MASRVSETSIANGTGSTPASGPRFFQREQRFYPLTERIDPNTGKDLPDNIVQVNAERWTKHPIGIKQAVPSRKVRGKKIPAEFLTAWEN